MSPAVAISLSVPLATLSPRRLASPTHIRIAWSLPGEARIGNLSIDWTISQKNPTDAQIQAFFSADSKPKGVVIVMPSQRYAAGAYCIPRAAALKGK
jgi:hypothetical protein